MSPSCKPQALSTVLLLTDLILGCIWRSNNSCAPPFLRRTAVRCLTVPCCVLLCGACREPWVGFKVLPSGYTGTNPWSLNSTTPAAHEATAKALPSGLFTFWQDPNAADIGVQYEPAGVTSFTAVQQCLDACNDDGICAGVTIEETVDRTKIATTCKLLKGDSTSGKFKRTMVRTHLDRIGLPVFYLCLGDRSVSNDVTGCSPITTLEQVAFALNKRTQCSPAFIEAAKEQAKSYMIVPASSSSAAPVLNIKGPCVTAALQVRR